MPDSPLRPVLGITACNRRLGDEGGQAIVDRYIDAAARYADCVPLLIPARLDLFRADEVAARIDGLLLTGSPSNIAPSCYGDLAPGAAPFDAGRDAASLALIRAMRAADKPVFGICRGLQEINVAFGGTLARNVDAGTSGIAHHGADDVNLDAMFANTHDVTLVAGGLLANALDTLKLNVTSVHYEGIDRLGEGLRVEARGADGMIEAVSGPPGGPALLAVQWHPEWQTAADPASQLFFALLGRALRRLTPEYPSQGEQS
jgi:putative glutamine amidotransferase